MLFSNEIHISNYFFIKNYYILKIINIHNKKIKKERFSKLTLSFILMKVKAGFVENITKALNQIAEVKEAHAVTGDIDIIVKVEAKDIETIAKVVVSKIHKIDGVDRTATHIVVSL